MTPARIPSGFTLIELLVTLAIAVILMTIAVPSFQDFFRNSRMASIGDELLGSLMLARSEAMRRGQNVVVCTSTTGTSCTNNAGNWSGGWIVFANADNDTPPVVDAGEPILRVSSAIAGNTTLRASAGFGNFIRFNPSGQSNSKGSFVACQGGSLIGSRAILVASMGSAKMGSDSNHNNIPEDDTGADFTSCTP